MAEFLWLLIHDQGIVSIQNWSHGLDGVYLFNDHHESEALGQPDIEDGFSKLVTLLLSAVNYGEIEASDNPGGLKEWRRPIKKRSALAWVATYKSIIYPLRHFPKNKTDHLDEIVKVYERNQNREKAGQVKRSTGRKADPIKQAIIEKAKRIQEKNPGISAVKMARMKQVVKLLAKDARFDDLENILPDEYAKRFGKKPSTVEDWIREALKTN